MFVGLCVSYSAALNRVDDVLYACLVHLVRSYNKAYRGVVVYKFDENLLVGTPRRACNKELTIATEAFDYLDPLCRLSNGRHTVETCISCNNDICHPQLAKQRLRLLVLHEERGKGG